MLPGPPRRRPRPEPGNPPARGRAPASSGATARRPPRVSCVSRPVSPVPSLLLALFAHLEPPTRLGLFYHGREIAPSSALHASLFAASRRSCASRRRTASIAVERRLRYAVTTRASSAPPSSRGSAPSRL